MTDTVGLTPSSLSKAPGKRPPAPLLRDQLCFALYAGAHALTRRYKPLLAPLGLTYPQYLCMMVLWETDGATVTALGQQLMLDSGTLTPLLKRLEKSGHVRRMRDQADERLVRIFLTDAGQALRGPALHVVEAMVCATGQTLDELRRLRDDLVALRHGLEATEAEPG